MAEHANRFGFALVASAAVVSALGWIAVDSWLPEQGGTNPIALSILRTLFTLLPVGAAFLIANQRQRRTHKVVAQHLQDLRQSLLNFQRLRRIEHELHTMDRLSKVAREAVKNTATSAKELFLAIEVVDDVRIKERLVDRFKNHANSVQTVLTAVKEQMEESGRAIYRELSADESIHVLQREIENSSKGLDLAKQLLEQRGVVDGLQQMQSAAQEAERLQNELVAFKAIQKEANS
jgi:hypothetical protein